MINFSGLWNRSGKQYQEYALKFPQYKLTNEKLIQLAKICPDQTIVDLACGTGLTTKEILKIIPDINKIYAVDFSKEMINIAKEFIQSKKVTFIVADAQNLDKFILEKVDIILCNAAFWQFQNQNKVIETISKLLKNNGKFIFNLPQQFFYFEEQESNQKLIIDTIFSEMRKIKFEPRGKLKSKLKIKEIEELFKATDLVLDKTETINIGPRTLEDFFNFFKIPATASFFEDVPKEKQEQILNSAYEKLINQIKQINNNKWIYFVFKKTNQQ